MAVGRTSLLTNKAVSVIFFFTLSALAFFQLGYFERVIVVSINWDRLIVPLILLLFVVLLSYLLFDSVTAVNLAIYMLIFPAMYLTKLIFSIFSFVTSWKDSYSDWFLTLKITYKPEELLTYLEQLRSKRQHIRLTDTFFNKLSEDCLSLKIKTASDLYNAFELHLNAPLSYWEKCAQLVSYTGHFFMANPVIGIGVMSTLILGLSSQIFGITVYQFAMSWFSWLPGVSSICDWRLRALTPNPNEIILGSMRSSNQWMHGTENRLVVVEDQMLQVATSLKSTADSLAILSRNSSNHTVSIEILNKAMDKHEFALFQLLKTNEFVSNYLSSTLGLDFAPLTAELFEMQNTLLSQSGDNIVGSGTDVSKNSESVGYVLGGGESGVSRLLSLFPPSSKGKERVEEGGFGE